jgi:hypothetical protein
VTIENLKKHMILALLLFLNIVFWLYIASPKNGCSESETTEDFIIMYNTFLPLIFHPECARLVEL